MVKSDCKMKAIGGYFELADYEEHNCPFPHKNGLLLNTGRNALEYILRSIDNIKGIYLPYFTCEVVLEPLKKLHISYKYYHINSRFEIADEINLKEGEYIIANNYFGIKDAYIQFLAEKYGQQLIVDSSQALLAKPISGIKTFYSTRKYVGVADGGIAYIGNLEKGKVDINEVECTIEHDKHLYIRKQFGAEIGFAEYKKNEAKLDNQPIRWMSDTTKHILEHIDYQKIIFKRKTNFSFLHNILSEKNFLELPKIDSFVCPMIYPFITKFSEYLRKRLIDNKVFVAKYWPNIHKLSTYDTEYDLVNQIIPIPCDQRYDHEDLKKIIEIIKENEI